MNAIDLRPLVIRDRGRRGAAARLATEHGIPEHQVIATHAAVEAFTLTDLDDAEYDESFADWASAQNLAAILREAPVRLGISTEEARQLTLAVMEYRPGVRRNREGYRWHDEHDPARRRVAPRRGRPRMN